ncbi:MAG TPA: hypothetical protein PKA53_06965 [Sphingobacterium sp.]|nr:hypothetical protein [Sphingobacterium sp.]
MAIVSRNLEIQEELSEMYNSLISEKNKIQQELVISRFVYKSVCEKHINNGFNYEQEWLKADKTHYERYIEYDMYCHIVEIIHDFQDLYGHFPEYEEMYATLHRIMLRFADDEEYELAAIIKRWVDRIKTIISSIPLSQHCH